MNTNENARTNAPEDVIVLGVASVETKGPFVAGEGMGGRTPAGISDE